MINNEGQKGEPQRISGPEINPERAFSILFPKYPFANLPEIDVRSVAVIPIEFIVQTYFDGSFLFKAKDAGQGYARRVDLPYFDKVTARALLLPTFLPDATIPKPSEIRDLIASDEITGGGISHIFSAPDPKALLVDFDPRKSTSSLLRGMRVNIIGIRRKKGFKPTGLLIYIPGPRPPKPKSEPVFVAVGKLKLDPVHT